jgi:hypothetical protein
VHAAGVVAEASEGRARAPAVSTETGAPVGGGVGAEGVEVTTSSRWGSREFCVVALNRPGRQLVDGVVGGVVAAPASGSGISCV